MGVRAALVAVIVMAILAVGVWWINKLPPPQGHEALCLIESYPAKPGECPTNTDPDSPDGY